MWATVMIVVTNAIGPQFSFLHCVPGHKHTTVKEMAVLTHALLYASH
jgi:hypothetical protein